jgi:hypothetical protein
MEHIIGVSWPRSGHHLLVNLLRAYFGKGFGYCEFYSPQLDCCRSVPCARRDRIHLTKNHDFDLTLPQLEGQKYLIQYRDFIPSVVSNYELFLMSHPDQPDTRDTFAAFAGTEFGRHRAFMRRWVQSDFGKAQLQLSYEQLVTYPHDCLRLAVWWVDPGQPIDEARIERVVREIPGQKVENRKLEPLAGVGVHAPRDVTRFRHYDEKLFALLARLNLTRDEVVATFRRVLGRDPAPMACLRFQTLDSVATLDATLRDSKEFRLRQRRPAPRREAS